jgi:hypothetical protein
MPTPIRNDFEGILPVYVLADIPAALAELGVAADQIARVETEIEQKRAYYATQGWTNIAPYAAVHDGWKATSFWNEAPGNAHTIVSGPQRSYPGPNLDGTAGVDRSFYGKDYTFVVRVLR